MKLPKTHWFNITEYDGVLWMFFNHYPPKKVGLAKSVDGLNFEVVRPVIFSTGRKLFGDWDCDLIESHQVLRLNDLWRMYYCGYRNGHWRIGYADTVDFTRWMKHGPILDLGSSSWENVQVADPYTVNFRGQHLMYYMGKGKVWQVGVAIEYDGKWIKHHGNPIIKADQEWNKGCMVLSGVSIVDGKLVGAAHGYNPDTKIFTGYTMLSDDGFTWEQGRFLGTGIIHPEIHNFNGNRILYYADPEYNFHSGIL